MHEMHEAETPVRQPISHLHHCESCNIRIMHMEMTLDEYLQQNRISGPAFASRIGVDPATVYRIRRGHVLPHRRTIKAIVRETNSQVTVEDLVLLGDDEREGYRS